MPALQASAPATPYAGNGHTNGAHAYAVKAHPANAHMAVPIAMRTNLADDSQPILPPRPTGRMQASGTSATPSSWKSWPVIVIAIAVVAIITAVILMVWPPGSSAASVDGKTLAPPPAPERMDTNPLPPSNGPQSGADPWSNRGGAAPDPGPAQPSTPPSVPDIDDIQPPNLSDPFRGGGFAFGVKGAILSRACHRLAACPNASNSALGPFCQLIPPSPVPTCAAAQRCFSAIDQMPCDDAGLAPTTTFGLILGMRDCFEAIARC